MKKSVRAGLFQALGLGVYISLVAIFMQNAETWLGRMNNISGPILFLTMFSFSALMCGLITFFYPVKLIWIDKRPKEALETVLYMVLFLFIFLMGVLLVAALT